MNESQITNGGGAPSAEASNAPLLASWRQLRWARWLPSLAALLLLLVSWELLSAAFKSLAWVFQPVLVPLMISGALAYLIKPLADWLDGITARWIRRAHVRHTLSVLNAMAVAVGGLAVGLFIVVPNLAAQLAQAVQRLPGGFQRLTALAQPILEGLRERYPTQYEQVAGSVRERVDNPLTLIEPVLVGLSATFSNAIGVVTSLINLLLIPFFVYYMLKDASGLQRRSLQLVPARHRATVMDALAKVDEALSAFVRGQLVVCSSMAVMYALGFSLLGVPSALSLGFLSGFGHLIPYIGTFLAGLLTCTLAMSDAPSWMQLGLIIGVYVIVQSVESFYLTPFVLGERLDLHPFLVIIGLVVGHHLLGILGVILTVPALAVGKVLAALAIEHYERSAFYRYGAPGSGLLSPNAPLSSSPAEATAEATASTP
ncbi:MAG: hypothetical protein CFK52_00095 [Chloracidobacterium sp. CP2_5A]|nr:MAG: hypothetical protein CFK52_00095 [Chloracidobacterium sp. CP2_5A]